MSWRKFYRSLDRLLENEVTWVILFFVFFMVAMFYFLNAFAGLLYALVVYLFKLIYDESKRTHKYTEAQIGGGAEHGKKAKEDEL